MHDGRFFVKGIRIFIAMVMGIFISIPAAVAADFTQNALLQFTALWGETSNETTFREGKSRLDWPMDMQLASFAYSAGYRDFIEFDFFLHASPWMSSGSPMKDFDWLDESYHPWCQPHDGIDVYSESPVDSKALIFGTAIRAYPLSVSCFSAGILVGYHNQKMDFRAYDTNQVGYGSWQNQTASTTGRTSTYNVKYRFWEIGLTGRLHAGNVLKVTADASVIPYAEASDEDDHIRRFRTSTTECTGYGGMISLSTQFALSKRWFVSSSCSRVHISTDGHQRQYWYGNDPATGFDDTGQVVSGIDAEIIQDSFSVGIALGCSL